MLKKIGIIVTLLFFVSPVHGADFEKAMRAYDQGNFKIAAKELIPLAEQGHGKAQELLSNLYVKGQGVKQDYKAAFGWAKLAAEQGLPMSQVWVGKAYSTGGWGVERNRVYGLMWLLVAEASGDERVKIFAHFSAPPSMDRNKGPEMTAVAKYMHKWWAFYMLKKKKSMALSEENIESEKLARECIEKNFKNCTNEPEKNSSIELKKKNQLVA